MNDLLKHADDLIGKINRLLDKNDRLAADILEKEERIRELNSELKMKNERLKKLEEEAVSGKLAENILLPGADSKEMKKKVNEYLREIDRCIAKLSAEG